MIGRYCQVVPLEIDAHAEALFVADQEDTDGRSWTYMPYGPFTSLDDYRQWLRRDCSGDDPLFHTILDSRGRPSGIASYLRIQPAAGSIEVGHIHYAPRLQRTTASSEAMFLMMRRAFDELGYRRYEWKCDALNAASRKAARRLGFTFEGIFRQATVYKGRNRDTAWLAITDRDWPKIRASFERWLDPSNHDADGRQVAALQMPASPVSETTQMPETG
jgi:RimJ/RimL family protein N-acetyltransferase